MLSHRFEEAIIYAIQLHAQQKRKGSETPYIAHLLAVTSIVLEQGGNEDEAIAALLHDAIEDQGGETIRLEIQQRFGETVADIVSGCTNPLIRPWRACKEVYIDHLRTASPSVRLVASADKLHNARSILQDYHQIGEELWARFTGGKEGVLWYYRSVTDTLLSQNITPLGIELNRVVTEIEHVARTYEQ
ncbi:HD domain-containing protein [Tengunoibacter tsumagoiensis]|uniref:Guanosine polyphosphate pyrophosphohydrolase n=1 Tax=Tengunoibacter tsumagoiensis TaxID=2014871 RepID=A0A402A5Q8_9CHLR|nr:HD domain-containing protein [Tengunoibacter tsumagoiensis]GCE14440.1 guanosine polyphosphate pyrophosphohydrolase [Tengunoibacter tsumagoiensis]